LTYLELRYEELLGGAKFGLPEVVAKLQSCHQLRVLRLTHDSRRREDPGVYGDALKAMLLAVPSLRCLKIDQDPFGW
jgi:hypothetical protein